MVTYGSWQEPVTYTERWRYGRINDIDDFGLADHTIDPVPESFGVPLTRNQWRAAGGFSPDQVGRVWGFGNEGRTAVPEVGYEEPDFGTDIPSKEAWGEAVADDEAEFSGTFVGGPIAIEYNGGIERGVPVGLLHSEAWYAETFEAMPVFQIRTGSTNWNAIAGVPAVWPEGAIGVEIDPARNTFPQLSRSESMRLEFALGGSNEHWHLLVKDIAQPGSGWLLSDNDREVAGNREGVDLGQSGEYDFDVAPVQEWRDAWTEYETYPTGRLPEFAISWMGGWPGNFVGGPPGAYPVINPDITIYYTWSAPRWRWVYAEPTEPTAPPTVPYRRVYPRDDGRAGGAGRTFPRPASQQSSNRTFGGYL